ncbi:MAG: 50S ribosomal protein L10 [Phycisphaerae bacterium]|nr:50S ribosomal protein L10 [Phycisphaerae bacterium]
MVAQATVGAKAPARIKTLLVKELVEDWQGLQTLVVVCPIGLDALVSNQLRASLTSKNIKMTVVKNSVARLALSQLDLAPAAELLDAPSAICYGGESVVDIARELVDWSKKVDAFRIRGAFLEGQLFSAEQVHKLAAMLNRVELLAQIAGLIASPAGRIASTLTSLGGRIAGSIKTLAEKLAQQAPPPEPAPKEKEEEQDVQTEETPKPESSAPDEPTQPPRPAKEEGTPKDIPDGK